MCDEMGSCTLSPMHCPLGRDLEGHTETWEMCFLPWTSTWVKSVLSNPKCAFLTFCRKFDYHSVITFIYPALARLYSLSHRGWIFQHLYSWFSPSCQGICILTSNKYNEMALPWLYIHLHGLMTPIPCWEAGKGQGHWHPGNVTSFTLV